MNNNYLLRNNVNSGNKFDKYLIILIISLGMGDIASPLLLSRILAILFLPSMLMHVNKCGYVATTKRIFILLLIYSLFSLVWTYNFSEGCKAIVYNVIHFTIYFEILVFCRFANNPLESISKGWTFVVFFLSVFAVWEILTGHHLSLARETDQTINLGGVMTNRILATTTFSNYNSFVTLLCFAMPWLFYRLSIVSKYKVNSLVLVLTLILASLVIFIDGSRGGLFSVIVIIGVYICFSPKGTSTLVTSCLFLGALLFILMRYGEQIFVVLTMKSEGQGLTSDSSRIEIWKACLIALLNSFGLGAGIGGIKGSIESVSTNIINVPHNMVIEVLLEYGVVFGILFIGFILRLLRKGSKLHDKNRRMAVLMAILALPFYGIINSLYLKSPETFVLFATLFVFVYYERVKPICK